MARLTLDQINQLTPDMASYLQSLGYAMAGTNDDGSPRIVNDEGNPLAPEQVNAIMSGEDINALAADQRRMQGIIDIADYDDPGSIAEYAKKGWSSPEAYLSQLYGGGERVGDYFVLPEAQDVRSAQMVGTPVVYNSPGLLKDFLTQGALLFAGGYGLNALTAPATAGGAGAGAGATAGADAAWGVNAAGTGAGTAAGEFGLSGATAGNLAGTGGLSSTAGLGLGANAGTGALGLGSGAAGAAAMGAGSGALLTPAIAGAAGIGAGAYGLGAGGAGLTAPQAMGGVGGASTTTAGAGTALGRVLGGTATADDWLSILGGAGSTLLGVAGSNAQADAYGDVASQYLGLGAPFRDKLLQSYDPGFSMADQPDFQNALDVGAQAAARATSARVGNPVDNPGAYAEMQKYISGSLALPQLNTYRSQLGSFGQLGTNTAGTASMGEASQAGGTYDAIGAGLAGLTKPKSPYEDLLKGILGNQNAFKLNTGFSL